jgi:hypothetical protein
MFTSQPQIHEEPPLPGAAQGQAALTSAAQACVLEAVNERPERYPGSSGVFEGIKRLVILIPDLDTEEARLSHYIWSLAAPQQMEVLLVSLVQVPGDEFHALRRLTSIASITRDTWVKVDTQVLFGRSWVKAVKPLLKQDDLLVCPSGQTAMVGWGKKVSLEAALSSAIKKPVHVIPSFFQSGAQPRLAWVRRLPFWVGLVIILASFFFLEVDVNRSITDWTGQVILIGLILVEITLLYWWTSITG